MIFVLKRVSVVYCMQANYPVTNEREEVINFTGADGDSNHVSISIMLFLGLVKKICLESC